MPSRIPFFRPWALAAVAVGGFLLSLEFAARRHGLPGPITNQAREVVYAPKSGPLLYAAMALMMVVLTRRQRFVAVGAPQPESQRDRERRLEPV